jgi:hypothetical protein
VTPAGHVPADYIDPPLMGYRWPFSTLVYIPGHIMLYTGISLAGKAQFKLSFIE